MKRSGPSLEFSVSSSISFHGGTNLYVCAVPQATPDLVILNPDSTSLPKPLLEVNCP